MPDRCPWCDNPLKLSASKPGGVSKSTRTGRDWFGFTVADAFRPRRRRLDHTAQAGTWPRDVGPASQPAGCAPGETQWRKLDQNADLVYQARMGRQCAGYFVVFGVCVIIRNYWPAAYPLTVIVGLGDLVAAAVFIRLNWDILWRGDDGRLVTREREPDKRPVTAPREWHVKAEMADETGRKSLYDVPEITKPWAWHRFCKAVMNGRNFSGAEAKKHKVPPKEWDAVSFAWVSNRWLRPFSAGETPELLARGRAWVRAYAETPPEEG